MSDAVEAAGAQALAQRFALLLRDLLGTPILREIDTRNRMAPAGTCASHDFCDANMVMELAFIEIFGQQSLSEDEATSNANTRRWNSAWRIAVETGFVKLLSAAPAHPEHADLKHAHPAGAVPQRWRIVVSPSEGETFDHCKGTFASSEAACAWISREQLNQRYPGCRLSVEPETPGTPER